MLYLNLIPSTLRTHFPHQPNIQNFIFKLFLTKIDIWLTMKKLLLLCIRLTLVNYLMIDSEIYVLFGKK